MPIIYIGDNIELNTFISSYKPVILMTKCHKLQNIDE